MPQKFLDWGQARSCTLSQRTFKKLHTLLDHHQSPFSAGPIQGATHLARTKSTAYCMLPYMSPAVGPHYKPDHSTSGEELWAPCRTWVRCVTPCHQPHWWWSAGFPAGPWQNHTHIIRNFTTSLRNKEVHASLLKNHSKNLHIFFIFMPNNCTNCEWGLGALMRTKWGLFHRKGPHEDLGPQWGPEGRLCTVLAPLTLYLGDSFFHIQRIIGMVI